MSLRKLFALMTVTLAVSSVIAQEPPQSNQSLEGADNKTSEGFSSRDFRSLGDFPADDRKIYGESTKGADAPEGAAILGVLNISAEITPLLGTRDSLLLGGAKANLQRTGRSTALREDVCRRAIALRSSGYSANDAAELGRQLAAMDEATNEGAITSYRALLNNMSTEGAALVESRKEKMQSEISFFQTDYEQQGLNDPDWLVGSVATNCKNADKQ